MNITIESKNVNCKINADTVYEKFLDFLSENDLVYGGSIEAK